MLEPRCGSVCGIYDRLAANGRVSDRAILNKVEFRLNPVLSHRGFRAYQMVFWSTAIVVCMWQGDDSDPDFAQDALAPGQFAQQWEPPTVAQGVMLTETANCKLRHLQAR